MKSFLEYIKENTDKDIKWAIGENSYLLQDKWIKIDTSLVYLDIKKVMKNTDSLGLDINSKTGGTNANINRIKRLYSHIENGGFLDPPLIGYNDVINKISFTNGRHRTFVAYKLGYKKIPFYVPNEQKEFFVKNYS